MPSSRPEVSPSPAVTGRWWVERKEAGAISSAHGQDSHYVWSGFYLGAHGGLVSTIVDRGDSKWDHTGNIVGAHAGLNVQTGRFVHGLEGDVGHTSNQVTHFLNAATNVHIGMDWHGSVRARAGIVTDRTLIFGTAGVAFTRAYGQVDIMNGGGPRFDHRLIGWTVGIGAERALTDNLLLRGEFRFADYGNINEFPFAGGNHRITERTLRAGISYKF